MLNMVFPLITEYEWKLPYFVTGIGCKYSQEKVFRPQGHPGFQWIQCHKGRGELIIRDKKYSIGENQGMLLFPDEPHEYYSVGQDWIVDWITFGGSQVEGFIKQIAGIERSGVFHVSQPEVLLSKIRNTLTVELSDISLKSLECSCMAYDILVNLLKFISVKNDNSMSLQYKRLNPLLNYIEKKYTDQLSLEELASVIGITPQHLCVIFKKTTGMRVFEYLTYVRINKSKEAMLKDPCLTVKEVAFLSGFTDVSYFCLKFRKLEHMSPKEFIRLHT